MTKRDANICKAIAVIMMYVHHLFWGVSDIADLPIVYGGCDANVLSLIGYVCKVCVSVFVFLSGYGTTKSCSMESSAISKKNIKQTIKRLIRVLMSFQFVFIVAMCFSFFG